MLRGGAWSAGAKVCQKLEFRFSLAGSAEVAEVRKEDVVFGSGEEASSSLGFGSCAWLQGSRFKGSADVKIGRSLPCRQEGLLAFP